MAKLIPSITKKGFYIFTGIVVLLLIVGSNFYWYEIRLAQIKHDCSWVKRYQDAIPAKPGLTQEEINKDCNEIVGNPFYKSMTCNLKPILPEPAKSAKDWWGEANAEEYKFCLHDKGL